MDITPQLAESAKRLTAYGDGGFTINGERHTGSLLLLPELVLPWHVTNPATLTLADFEPLIEHAAQTELLLIGCGTQMAMIPPELRHGLRKRGIGIDAMDTGAACRTYSILLQEGRLVAAALIAV